MGNKLKQAFDEASKLSTEEQEAFAAFLLEELHDEHRWQELYKSSHDVLSKLANEARLEFESGDAEPLDID